MKRVIHFLKGLIAKKPEPEENVRLNELGQWIDSRIKSASDFLAGQLNALGERASAEIASARQGLDVLENAQLLNSNIPEKAKHLMEGNRQAYIKITGYFLDAVRFPASRDDARQFTQMFGKKIAEYTKTTSRQFAILSEFFSEEAAAVAKSIKQIDSAVQEVGNAVAGSGIEGLESVRERIAALTSGAARRKHLDEEITRKESWTNELLTEKARLGKEISEKEASPDISRYNGLKARLAETREECAKKESELSGMFSPLDRPMRKYERVALNDRDILNKYIESPISALTHDFGFRILNVLANMRRAVHDNTLELKDDTQKIKYLNAISAIDKDFLSKFISSYAQTRKKERDMEEEADSITAVRQLAGMQDKLKINSAMLTKAQSDIELMKKEQDSIDIIKMERELCNSARQNMGIKLRVEE